MPSHTDLRIAAESEFDRAEFLALYASVEWTGYTEDPERMLRGLVNSHLVLTARDGAGTLLGMARTISDDAAVCYVQDLLVHPGHHRAGIGRALVEELKERYRHCRFVLLSTEAESAPGGARNHAFYRSLGFLSLAEKQMAGFGLPRNRG
ncbi:GNAT family N-acetyltransferase [Kitasatospora viridis]|nr:GNAT family N-acetyltransferase [Kitasatospora viridis]